VSDRDVEAVFTHGDTRALLQATLQDESNNNAAIDVTGYTVNLYAEDRRSDSSLAAIPATLTDATNGIVTFDCRTITATEGYYDCQIELIDTSAEIQRMKDFAIVVKEKVET